MVLGIVNCGCKTMGAKARGGGSYKNMSLQFASKPNFLKTKFDFFHRQVSNVMHQLIAHPDLNSFNHP